MSTPSPEAASHKPFVMAVTGYAGAGKDRFATMLLEQLQARNLQARLVSSGDLIRHYVKENNLGDPSDRAVVREAVNVVAKTESYTFWLERALDMAKDDDVLLYPGLRQTVEVKMLHDRGDIVIGIDVPVDIRYQRAQMRARPGDAINFETFKVNEEAERNAPGQQLDAVLAEADIVIANNGTLEQLEAVAKQVADSYPKVVATRFDASTIAV